MSQLKEEEKIFNPIDVSDETQMTHQEEPGTPSESKVDNIRTTPESINLFSYLENKDLNIRQEKNVKITTQPSISPQLQDLDYTFVPENVPKEFIQTVTPFFDRATEIYTFWHKALIAYKKI
jgi:hypothetical protein